MSNISVLRKLVDSQIRQIGSPVSNFFGAVAGQSPAVLLTEDQRFLVAQIAGTRLLSPEEFYSAYTNSQTRNYQVLQAHDGIIVANSISTDANTPSTFLIRSVTENAGPINLSITIVTDTPTSEFAIYVDGVLQRQGHGTLTIALSLAAGRRLIEITAVCHVFGLSVPPNIRFIYDLDVVPTPVWSNIRIGFIDPTSGGMAVELEWFNDTRVGGWIVFRRTLEFTGPITAVSILDSNGEFTFEISGDWSAKIVNGGDISAGQEPMGTAIADYYEPIDDVTVVRARITPGRSATTQHWVGREVGIGQFVEQNRVRRTTRGGPVSWTDMALRIGTLYEYVLQAFGLFNELQLSALSEVRRVVPGDLTPPGSIVFEPGYPLVHLDVVVAKFTTPIDFDYDGVKVTYYNLPTDGYGTSTGTNTTVTLNDTLKAWVVNQFSGFIILITGGKGAGQVANVVSNTATEITISAETAWSIVPDATSSFEIYTLINVITDYGLPNTSDEIRFSAVGTGLYYFQTFDRALNTQPLNQAAVWNFDGQDDLLDPITSAHVYDRTSDGKQSQTEFGMTLYSVPPAMEVFADTFEEVDNQPFTLYDSGTFGPTNNSTRHFEDSTKSWTNDAYVGKWIRISTAGPNFNRIIQIESNSTNSVNTVSDIPMPPNNMAYQIIGHAPNVTPTATETWTLTPANKVAIINFKLQFVGVSNTLFEMYTNIGRTDGFRYEATITRGNGLGSNLGSSSLTYKGASSNATRFEYGIVHETLDTVTIRRRFNNGSNPWITLKSGYLWSVGTGNRLIVEVDNDIHTFKIAEEFGHNEVFVGRVQMDPVTSIGTLVGWSVVGNPEDSTISADAFDDVRVLDFNSLVRIKYRLLPYEDPTNRRGEFLEVPLWNGTATNGNLQLLEDTSKIWSVDELRGAFVRILDGAGTNSDIEIQSNNATNIIPKLLFNAAITAGSIYVVYEKYYTGTERLRWFATRLGKQSQILLYHGERQDAPDEIEKRLLIDPNSIPELTIALAQLEPFALEEGWLQCTITPDDDVATYRLLLRKNNWPLRDLTGVTTASGALTSLASITDSTIGVGLWGLAGTDYAAGPHTATGHSSTPATIVADLTAAQAAGYKKFFLNMAGEPSTWQNVDGTINFNTYKANMATYQSVVAGLQPFIDSGFLINYLVSDFFDVKYVGSISNALVREMGLYSKSLFPKLTTVVKASSIRMGPPTGGWSGAVDYGWSEYRGPNLSPSLGQTAAQFYNVEITQFRGYGISCVFGYDIWNGGDGTSTVRGINPDRWVMSANEIKACVDAAAVQTGFLAFMGWDRQTTAPWEPLELSAEYYSAFAYAVAQLGNRTVGDPINPPTPPPVGDPIGEPDLQYTRFIGNTDFQVQTFQVDVGNWFCIVIPYDTNGAPGPYAWASLLITGFVPPPVSADKFLSIEIQPPAAATSGVLLSPQPVIQLRNADGTADISAGVSVTVIPTHAGPPFPQPVGMTPTDSIIAVTDSTGKATFTTITLTGISGAGDSLTFTAGGYLPVKSGNVLIGTAASPYVSILIQPSTAASGQFLNPTFTVGLRDSSGALLTTTGIPIVGLPSIDAIDFTPNSQLTTLDPITGIVAARFSGSILTGAATTVQVTFDAAGYVSTDSEPIILSNPVTYSLSNINAETRVMHVDESGLPTSAWGAVQINWTYPTNFVSPNAAGTLDISIWDTARSLRTKVIALGIPVWTKQFGITAPPPGVPGAGTAYAANAGNIIIPRSITTVALGGTTFTTQRSLLAYKLVFKVNGVEVDVKQNNYSYMSTAGIAIV